MRNFYKFALLCLFTSAWSGVRCYAQQPAAPTPSGVVTLAQNATLGTGHVSEGTTVFSGDLLRTGDQGRLNVQAGTVQLALGANTSVRVFRGESRVIVELEGGTLGYSAKASNEDLTLFALDIRLVPKTSVPAAGQISIISRCDAHVTAIRSTIEVTSGRESRTIEETKSYRVVSEFGVDYRDSWQPVLADYPDYPRDAQYHHSHAHVACPAGPWQTAQHSPIAAGAGGHFAEIVGGGGAIITGFVIHEVLESSDRP